MDQIDEHELFQLFTSVDSDVDRVISKKELFELLEMLQYECSNKQQEMIESVVDENCITFDWFLQLIKEGFEVDKDVMPFNVFMQYDKNSSGKINVHTLISLLTKSGVLSEDEIDEILRDLEIDSDKMVEYSQFCF